VGYGMVNATVLRWANLDGAGNFYRWAYAENSSGDKIMRFDADGSPPRVVYDEDTDPICKLHAFTLISGR
jgi:hypothetical protein